MIIAKAAKEKRDERRRIDRALAALEDAVSRCREKDVRYDLGVSAALSFLAAHAGEKWPFEQFEKALADPGMVGPKPGSPLANV